MFIGCLLHIFYIELKSSAVNLKDHRAQALVDLEAGDEDVKKEREDVLYNEDYEIKVVDFVNEYKMAPKKGGACSKKMVYILPRSQPKE